AALVRGGYAVVAAHDGEAGLEIIRRTPPHAVVLDLLMPKLSGIEVLQAMRADPTLRDVPVIVLTGQTPSPSERSVLDGLARRLLMKESQAIDDLLHELAALVPARTGPARPES